MAKRNLSFSELDFVPLHELWWGEGGGGFGTHAVLIPTSSGGGGALTTCEKKTPGVLVDAAWTIPKPPTGRNAAVGPAAWAHTRPLTLCAGLHARTGGVGGRCRPGPTHTPPCAAPPRQLVDMTLHSHAPAPLSPQHPAHRHVLLHCWPQRPGPENRRGRSQATAYRYRGEGGGGGWHKASVSDCLPLAAPIGLSPLLILTLCGSERVLVLSTGGGGGWRPGLLCPTPTLPPPTSENAS